MLFSISLDNFRARRMAIAQDARQVSYADDGFSQFGGKGRSRLGKITPLEQSRDRGYFPVAGRRVLAAGNLLRRPVK
jgi:hypothetical protein